ncbi:FRG domain-containing protein [Natrialba sp. PRR66]|uniref:FRG domain-containing protein n=1 Tax=Natrialba sp. PRR66 TaxID=3098146 RepID=UPI002B1DA58B|nr:FRG domain-containing protein [Natrialba sp. PRR66]
MPSRSSAPNRGRSYRSWSPRRCGYPTSPGIARRTSSGEPHVDHPLETSINRFVVESGKWNLEPLLLRNFAQYAADEIDEIDESQSIWHLLSIAQHYGLPTRLLDWSF